MRETLFKAKRNDNGKWIEGSLLQLDSDKQHVFIIPRHETASSLTIPQIVAMTMERVRPETVSQYTMTNDIKKRKIWTNNIVRYFETVENYDYNSPCFDVNRGIYEQRRTRHKVEFIAVVRFDEEMSAYVVNPIYCTEHLNYMRRRLGEYPMEDIEVIGNIFDDKDIEVKSIRGLHIIQSENGGWEIKQN